MDLDELSSKDDLSRAKTKIDLFLRPFRLFLSFEAAGGILLLASTLVAIILANSSYKDLYNSFLHTYITFSIDKFVLKENLLHWINDGLMAVFFFVIGLEIKREFVVGDLSSPKRAALPIIAAIGGMIVPALIYRYFCHDTSTQGGWGIPMATDIAFALGIISLLGNRVPVGLKIFLAALAIVDDLGAVLVIAFFYTSKLNFDSLLMGSIFFASLISCNLLGVRSALVYGILGIGGLWLSFLLSGVHPTVAGVLAALCIPARTRINTKQYIEDSREALKYFEESGNSGESVLTNKTRLSALFRQIKLSKEASAPLQLLEKTLHPWAIYLIMPIFAFANAGIELNGNFGEIFEYPSVWGIMAGLIIGKQLGVFGFSWVAVKLGLATLPLNTSWKGLYGASCLAGIGFTMSIFIASLAFKDMPEILVSSKFAILLASSIMGIVGYTYLRIFNSRK